MVNLKAMRKASEDDGLVEPFYVSYVPERIGKFIIDINGPIYSPAQFDYAVRVLEAADEDNPVQINLQCPGGSLDATDRMLHAMHKCRGHIHVIATGGCHSAATLILLEADSFELSENFSSLLHCGSLGAGGNLNEFIPQSAFAAQQMIKIFLRSYEGFLTEDEVADMVKGADIWLDADGWMQRAQARQAYFKAKEEEMMKPPKKPRKPKLKEVKAEELRGIVVAQ